MVRQYSLRLYKVTGMLILAQRSTVNFTGTSEQLEAAYKKVLIHNLLFGWWSIFAFVWNVMALIANARGLGILHRLVEEGPK